MKVNCPRCKEAVEYSTSNAFRPFCSERCKLIDLGHWAEGKYAIEAKDKSLAEEDSVDLPSDTDNNDDDSSSSLI